MDILAFYSVGNDMGWDRHSFDALSGKDALRLLSFQRRRVGSDGIRLYHTTTEDFPFYGLFSLNEFESDFNNEDFDGSEWWCVHLDVEVGDVMRICNRECIMDASNSHNPELVQRINQAYAEGHEDLWAQIMKSLYYRDYDEMIEKEIMTHDDWYDWWLLDWDWEKFAYDYLMKIADDRDLETILNFIEKQ